MLGGTFLTGGNDEDMYEDPRETAKRDRARYALTLKYIHTYTHIFNMNTCFSYLHIRTQAKASQGQKNLRSRITDRKAKQRLHACSHIYNSTLRNMLTHAHNIYVYIFEQGPGRW